MDQKLATGTYLISNGCGSSPVQINSNRCSLILKFRKYSACLPWLDACSGRCPFSIIMWPGMDLQSCAVLSVKTAEKQQYQQLSVRTAEKQQYAQIWSWNLFLIAENTILPPLDKYSDGWPCLSTLRWPARKTFSEYLMSFPVNRQKKWFCKRDFVIQLGQFKLGQFSGIEDPII